MRTFCLIIAFVLFAHLVRSQGFRTRIYLPGSLDHTTKGVFPVGNGYIGTGFCTDTMFGRQVSRLVVLGLDSSGALQWVKKYGDTSLYYYTNSFISRAFYKSGDFLYYAGCVRDSTNKQVGVLTKINISGDTVWQRVYRDPDPLEDVIPQMVTSSVDGGFLITGFFQHWGQHYNKCMLIKTDANGNELWRKKIGKSPPDVQDGKAIVQDPLTKKVVIAGYKYVGVASYNRENVLILDSLGAVLKHTGYIDGAGLDAILTKDSSVIVAGIFVNKDDYYDIKGYVQKVTIQPPNSVKWQKVIGNANYEAVFNSIIGLADGSFLVSESRDSLHSPPHSQIAYRKFTDKGDEVWSRVYDYGLRFSRTMTELTEKGGWVAAMEVVGKQPNLFFFVKYDSTGCDSTLEYCAMLSALPEEMRHVALVYPVPCDDNLYISANAALGINALRLFDFTGRLVFYGKTPFGNELKIPTSDLPEGAYLLRIEYKSGALNRRLLIRHE